MTVVAADPDSSRYGGGDGSPYFVESVGHYLHPDTVAETWPQSYDTGVVDRFERIGDRESLETTRLLARAEGLLVGGSSGTAVAAALRVAAGLGPDDVVVAILPDSGRNYLSKYFDDGWMARLGFLDPPCSGPRVRDVVDVGRVAVVAAGTTVGETLAVHSGGLVAVVTARRTDSLARSAPEVLGVVDPAVLRSVPPGDDVVLHAGSPPPAVGGGECAVDAHARVVDGPVVVLVDGRVVGVVLRASLVESFRGGPSA